MPAAEIAMTSASPPPSPGKAYGAQLLPPATASGPVADVAVPLRPGERRAGDRAGERYPGAWPGGQPEPALLPVGRRRKPDEGGSVGGEAGQRPQPGRRGDRGAERPQGVAVPERK